MDTISGGMGQSGQLQVECRFLMLYLLLLGLMVKSRVDLYFAGQ